MKGELFSSNLKNNVITKKKKKFFLLFIFELRWDEEKKENKKATNMTRWQIKFVDLLYFIFSTTKQNIVQINSQST